MKKAFYISILAVILAVVCLFSQACSDNSDKKEEKISYMTVYSDNSVLSEGVSFLGKRTINLYDEDHMDIYSDESALPKRTDTIFGNDIELQYRYSIKRNGHLVDSYVSSDEHYTINYQRTTGKIVLCVQEQTGQIGEPECTKEEMIKTATEFVKSNWKIFQDDNFSVHFLQSAAGNNTGIGIWRKVNGISTDELVIVYISQKGEIAGWNDFLRYPDGIPQVMQDAIADLNIDLCKKSVSQYVSECAKESSKKHVKIKEGSENFEILFGDNKKLAVRVRAKISTDGQTLPAWFVIMIPYDGQIITDSTEITHDQSTAVSGNLPEGDETFDMPETAVPIVVPPDTPENTDTISLEEIE